MDMFDRQRREMYLLEQLSYCNRLFSRARTEKDAREGYDGIAVTIRSLRDLGVPDWLIRDSVDLHPIALAEML
jgi:hypothetical protein